MQDVRHIKMESGAIIGIISSIIVVASASIVLVRYSKGESTWGRTLKYVAIEAGVILGALMFAVLLLDMFSAVDSSHGVMALGLPVLVGIVTFFIALIVLISSGAASYKGGHK
jgi:hypothetical protein